GRTPAHVPLRADQWRGGPPLSPWGGGGRGGSPRLCAPGHERARSRGTPVGPLVWVGGARARGAAGATGGKRPVPDKHTAREINQEPLENGPRYEKIAGLTRSILALPNAEIEQLIETCDARIQDLTLGRPRRMVRLRDVMMPVWADFYHEVVFQEECPPEAR